MKVAKFTKPLSVGLEPETYARIQRITDQAQISMAQWIREAIEFRLKDFIRIGGDDEQ
jgi:predicted DNA-binding protein